MAIPGGNLGTWDRIINHCLAREMLSKKERKVFNPKLKSKKKQNRSFSEQIRMMAKVNGFSDVVVSVSSVGQVCVCVGCQA